jgi:hypothetical protein
MKAGPNPIPAVNPKPEQSVIETNALKIAPNDQKTPQKAIKLKRSRIIANLIASSNNFNKPSISRKRLRDGDFYVGEESLEPPTKKMKIDHKTQCNVVNWLQQKPMMDWQYSKPEFTGFQKIPIKCVDRSTPMIFDSPLFRPVARNLFRSPVSQDDFLKFLLDFTKFDIQPSRAAPWTWTIGIQSCFRNPRESSTVQMSILLSFLTDPR